MNDLPRRLDFLVERLRTSYDGIGHSSGRPYIYFVYPPHLERAMRRLVEEHLRDDHTLSFYPVDVLRLTMEALRGQEERRGQLLNDPAKGSGTAAAIMRLWGRAVTQAVTSALVEEKQGRPVVVLSGLAALHPIGNPTSLMEQIAEGEPRHPTTGQMIPILALVPGARPPGTSRLYHFLGLERLGHGFYRGEEA